MSAAADSWLWLPEQTMNAPNTESLQIMLEREESDRDALALTVRQAQDHLERLNAQLRQFSQYRADYVDRWQQQFHQAGGIEIVQCYRSFMQRLDQAMQQLTLQQGQAELNLKRQRHRLVEAETRVAAIKKLVGRRVETFLLAQQRRDQKQTDEAAQRSAWLARQSLSAPALG
jgi:flagellar FliJ protein